MRRGRAVLLLAVAAGTLLMSAACGGGGGGASPSPGPARPSATPVAVTPSPSPELASPPPCPLAEPGAFPTNFPAVSPLGGGSEITPPTYPSPQLIEPGVSISRSLSGEEEQRVLGAVEALQLTPLGDGDEVNCVRVFTTLKDYDEYVNTCGGGKLGEFRDFEGLTFGYLPPGTYAYSPQYAAICPDGSVSAFGRELSTCCDRFSIWFTSGTRAVRVGGGARVYAAILGERPAVIVRGGSVSQLRRNWIALAANSGVIVIDADGLPLDEAVNIAIGIRCEMC